jgi:SAM-dependent methyltransferase
LRRFVIEAAGGYRGREAKQEFTSRLLKAFGWVDGLPPGATLAAALSIVDNGQRSVREVALLWNARGVLVEVVQHDVMLDFAWKELLRACLQLAPVPQYVLLTNQRDVQLYDLARERAVPRLSVALDDLPKYSEAFPFLFPEWVPGTTPKIIDVSRVSSEVADLVAKLYRSLKEQHPKRESDVVQFTLQCIITMFSEDIGLLPRDYFTTLLYEGTRTRDVEARLLELFRLMSTRDVPAPRVIPFFNGGLFTNPAILPLGEGQLSALTKAAEANWKYVDPYIFGSVFQGVMNDAERQKNRAHYTAQDDIMRVVGPTIVDPWRKIIRGAKSLSGLLDIRASLLKFRVLDPACGSGNFLYVAFRELYRLDTELLSRIAEFSSTQRHGRRRVTWAVGIQTSNFFGIDINPFAVALAKVTLNIAKKIAFDERREVAADLTSHVELEVDPSLPLDNLDKNIICSDALFTDWPAADAIVGNPPFMGGTEIRAELGDEYLKKLLEAFPAVPGRTDLCAYWFRRAHERLAHGARAGLVGTSGIRVGKARESSLDYIVDNGGTITNAVSSRAWPGEAAVNVSMVNWVRGPFEGPYQLIVNHEVYSVSRIPTHLQLHADVSVAQDIAANAAGMAEGVSFGHAAFRSCGTEGFPLDAVRGKSFIRPVATGDDLLRGQLPLTPDYCIDLRVAKTEAAAKALGGVAFTHLKKRVYQTVKARAESDSATDHYKSWLGYWWKPHWGRDEFFAAMKGLSRMMVCPKVCSRPAFAFISMQFVPTDTMKIFSFDDDYSFGVMQSSLHWAWTKARGGKMTERIRYTKEVWSTFCWPQEPTAGEVAAVALAARDLRHVRNSLMRENSWSLRALYQAAEVPGPHPLKDAQAVLDDAVGTAYGMPSDQEAIEFLLELNALLAEDEVHGKSIQGPGLPAGLDAHDPRWTSDDCIEPPGS